MLCGQGMNQLFWGFGASVATRWITRVLFPLNFRMLRDQIRTAYGLRLIAGCKLTFDDRVGLRLVAAGAGIKLGISNF